MNPRLPSIALLLFVLLSIQCTRHEQSGAELVYYNAKIWTGNPEQPWASAIAISGDSIVAIGEDYHKWAGANTRLIDLDGKLVTPGFIDNHVHFLSGGFQLASVDLRAAKTPQEFIVRLADFAQKTPQGRWITGGDWDHEAWDGELPRKEWIDSVTAGIPVFVSRLDGHMGLANSAALKLAGISSKTPDPAGGSIVRDAKGQPTGILKDEAMSLVFNVIPTPSEAQLDEALARAADFALGLGVTQVHDVSSFGGWTDLETYRRAHGDGKLPLRIYSFVNLGSWERLADFVKQNGRGDDMLWWGALKGFVDGSLGSTTAWFYEPFNDEPHTSGLVVTDTNDLRKWILAADAAQLHVGVHAIGDRANDWLLDVYEAADKQNGKRDRRFRIEHAQHLNVDALGRFASLGVIPSMQPYHAIDDGRWAEKRIGRKRCETTYAFRSLLDKNARLTFGSDWTVAPINPMEGIYAAVTRQTLDGKNPNGWIPEQKISVEEALRCYTINNAYAGFKENKTGALKPGFLADFVVLSDDIFEIQPTKIKEVKVLRTVIGGKERFVKQ